MDETLYENKILRLLRRTVKIEGQDVKRTVIAMPDAVMVIAVDTANNVHFLEEYMAPQEGFQATFVKGAIDAGDTPEGAAKRELGEELSMQAAEVTLLLKLDDRPSHLTTQTHVFVARGCTPLQNASKGDEEKGTLRKKTMPLAEMVKSRKEIFTCARCLAAVGELALIDSGQA